MARLMIPQTPQEITPEWLTEALRSTGAITTVKVVAVTIEPLPAGQGYTSQLMKLKLEENLVEFQSK